VCGHLGLTPQSVHALGGYRIQGRDERAAEVLMRDAKALGEAGAALLVVELVPSSLGKALTEALPMPVIGIGAGVSCSGQVLVLHDLLNLSPGRMPKFVRNFMEGSASVQEAVRRYVEDVKAGLFPVDAVHGY
jgi:3-methyl-2-oxobutanoate hydroxymethyltransferase